MIKKLERWFKTNASERGSKNIKKIVFIFVCKAAPFIDEELILKISKYLNMSVQLLSYYVFMFNSEFINCNKKIMQAKEKRTKYFIRKISFEKILQLDYLSENGKNIIMKSINYSKEKYANANKVIKLNAKCVSNRCIAKLTGISRSYIDRMLLNAKSNLQKIEQMISQNTI